MWLPALTLGLLTAPVALGGAYLTGFVLLSAPVAPPPPSPKVHRFRVVVPAHNEELGIAATVRNLLSLDYPKDAFSVLVVADNCSDRTADEARAAGAEVLERHSQEQRGKGYALLYAFGQLTDDVDAVVVVDADTLVSPNLLSAFSARLAAGAHAVQADYAVSNVHESWRTRLMSIAFGSFHIVRSRSRERLSLSAGLRGNGMCFTREILARVPHDAFSIVEDVEYGIRLGEAGFRVHYADDAHVYGEMVTTAKAAHSQRQRWEGGRRALTRAHARRLVVAGLKRADRVLLDLGLDLLMPPLSQFALASASATAVAGTAALVWGGPLWLVTGACAASTASVGIYVLRGWSVSRTGVRGLRDLALAPAYVAWKLAVGTRGVGSEWVRTRREAETRAASR